ncbi:MAG TPA: LLM class flavin-dependent oxidoreductase [Myxococcota bacterium]|jgi:alkanesulfonate monooxygenase SsuD/methylene tetrahydromethanopterin reductase-like flavin-dependent oxidoreductase (luciferase family)|nr:LLM class flavin-dependent oxidoreductase [Myxococcota bacterium]
MAKAGAIEMGPLGDEEMLYAPLPRRRALLERVAAAGLDHVFVGDHVSFHTGVGYDGIVQAATLLACEERLRVQIGVYLLALRHPVIVARQLATLCDAAPGRLVLGVGVGGEDPHELEICGVDPKTRGRRTDECLIALKGLLSGEPTTHRCEFFEFTDARIRPAPDPRIPILVGGRSDAALRRAARHGDGWIGVWCSPGRYAQVVQKVAQEAEAAGRSAVTWRHGLQIWVGVDGDRARARERLAKRMQGLYKIPYERFEKYSPYGTPAEIADFIAPYAEAGCTSFNVMAVGESSEACVDGVAEIKERLA